MSLALVQELAVAVKAPRMLYLHWPFGHALGEPGNANQQRTILHEMFSLARAAPCPGLVVTLPYQWKRQTYLPIADWASTSEVFDQALALVAASGCEDTSFLSSQESSPNQA